MTQIEFPHKIILPVVIVIALIVTLFSGLYTIQPGQVGFQKQF